MLLKSWKIDLIFQFLACLAWLFKNQQITHFFDEKATLEELKLQIIYCLDFRCYAMMGSFSESAQYLKVCLPAIQERYGPHSIEVGHELIKYTDVLLGK